jgi:hypothetical protein
MTALKVGDRVRVTEALTDHFPESPLPVGSVGTVVSIGKDGLNLNVLVDDVDPEEILARDQYEYATLIASLLGVDPKTWPLQVDEIETV